MRERKFPVETGTCEAPCGAESPLYLGIDGGGSKCKARLVDANGQLLAESVAGPANAFQDQLQAQESMLQSARDVLELAGLAARKLGDLHVGAGLAGVNIPRVATQMSQWQHPFAELRLETDIHIACLGAHGGADGGIIVAGTGSVAYCYREGRGKSFGGHGFAVGDKGSGAWLGFRAMQSALLAVDRLGPATSLLESIEAQLKATGLGLVDAMAGAKPRAFGALAPLVLSCAEKGDEVAVAIVQDGADYLGLMAARLLEEGAQRLCMLGGLAPLMLPWMPVQIREQMVQPQAEADVGAVHLAMLS